MSMLTQFIANCLVTGAIYSLVASGFSLTYHVHRMFNFAHGAIVAVGAYSLYYAHSALGLSLVEATITAIVLTGLCGLALDRFVYRHFRNARQTRMAVLVASFAILLLAESIFNLLFGPGVKSVYPVIRWDIVTFAGASMTILQIAIVATSIASLIVLFLVTERTRLGHRMKAISDNEELAAIVGLPLDRVYATTLIVSSITAGIAGCLLAIEQNVFPTLGSSLLLKGFIGTVIGGVGSIPGAMLGAYLLGSVEHLSVWFMPAGYRDVATFAILCVFLFLRPGGLMTVARRADE